MLALVGFSYNTWRLELTEENNNIRLSAFTMLTELAAVEQMVYSAHYDQDLKEGSPRKIWVKVGLIVDLSHLINPSVTKEAIKLREIWGNNWEAMVKDQKAANQIIKQLDNTRDSIKQTLLSLQ